jgi:hypothetical protein
MKATIFLEIFFKTIYRMLVIFGVVLYLSMPAHARKQKTFDKFDPPSDLILTLPDPMPVADKISQPSSQNLMATNHNATQTSAIKNVPVNVKCDVDVIQNTLTDVPLSSRIFGECGLHYHY